MLQFVAPSDSPYSRARRGGPESRAAKRSAELKEENASLEKENTRLRRTITELRLRNILLEEALYKKGDR
jgi:hypothetical protein